MRADRHGEYLVRLTRLGCVSCYLVREPDGFTLVDTAWRAAGSILAAAREAGAPIVRIVLTHAHVDHVGSLDALRAELPEGVEVAIGAREARLLAGDMTLEPGEPQAEPRGGFPRVATEPTRLLEPGDRVASLEAVAAPGHTPGQLAFLDVRDRTLLAGDAFQTLGGVAVAGVLVPLFPFPRFSTWHRPTAVETAGALRALAPSRLAVGHGRVLEEPAAAMERAIAEAAR